MSSHLDRFGRATLLACGLTLAALTAPLSADTFNVTIINPSFEALDAADVGTAGVSRWGVAALNFDPGDSQFLGTNGNDAQGEIPHGGQVANIQTGRIFEQNLGVTAVPGTMYTLNHFVGQRRDGGSLSTYTVELLEGTNTVFSQTVSTGGAGFVAAPAISGTATGTGQLTLRMTGLTGQPFPDMLSLTGSNAAVDSIFVANADFATPDVGDVATGGPGSWTPTGLAVGNGVFDPGAAQFPNSDGNNAIGGLAGVDGQVGNIEQATGSLSQNLGVTVSPLDTIYLNVAIGERAEGGLTADYSLELLLDGVPFETITNPVTPANGELAVAELIGTPPAVGELGIRFTSISGQTFLDSVNVFRTTAQAVPEPGTLAMFAVCGGLAAVVLGARRWRSARGR
jgi:hypothetical protein